MPGWGFIIADYIAGEVYLLRSITETPPSRDGPFPDEHLMVAHFTTPLARRVSIVLALFVAAAFSAQPGLAWGRRGMSSSPLSPNVNTTESAKTENKQITSNEPPPNSPRAKDKKVPAAIRAQQQMNRNPHVTPRTYCVSVPTSWWERFYVIFTGLLVGIGVIGAYLALRTLRAIEEQARSARSSAETAKESALAAKASADAAALNAQAVIDAERAWILVKNVGNPEGWYVPTKPDYLPGMVFEFEVYGKTPARVMDAIFHLENVTAKLGVKPSEPDIPPLPEYKSAGRSPEFPEGGRIMPSGQTFQIRVGLVQQMTEGEWLKLRDGKTVMCAFGIIEYEDSFGRKRETRTCYVYDFAWGGVIKSPDGTVLNPSGFRIGGPSAYNKAS